MITLDRKDRKILAALDFDARASLSKIAKKAGCSKQVVKYRLDVMQEKGLFRKCYALIDYFRTGHICYSIALKLKNVTKQREQAIISFLSGMKGVKKVYTQGGIWDFELLVYVLTTREFARLISRLRSRYEQSILHRKVFIKTRYTYFGYKFVYDQEAADAVTVSILTDKIPVGRKEWGILSLLEQDGRMPSKDISSKVRLSPETVRRKIRQFQNDGVIRAFRLDVAPHALGFQHYRLYLKVKRCTNKRVEEFISFCREHRNILYVSTTIELIGLTLNVFVKNNDEFLRVVNEIKYSYPDVMEDFTWNVVFAERN